MGLHGLPLSLSLLSLLLVSTLPYIEKDWEWYILWNSCFWAAYGCLYVFVPFVYFFGETPSSLNSISTAGARAISFTGRLLSTLFTYILLVVLMLAWSAMLKWGLDVSDTMLILIPQCVGTLCMALMCLHSTPRGLAILWYSIRRLFSSPGHRRRLQNQLDMVTVQLQTLKMNFLRLEGSESPMGSRVSWIKSEDMQDNASQKPTLRASMRQHIAVEQQAIVDKIEKLSHDKSLMERELATPAWRMNLLFFVLTSIFVTLWVLLLLKLGLSVVQELFGYLSRTMYTPVDRNSYMHALMQMMPSLPTPDRNQIRKVLGQTALILAFFGALMDFCVGAFFLLITLLGTFSKTLTPVSWSEAPVFRISFRNGAFKNPFKNIGLTRNSDENLNALSASSTPRSAHKLTSLTEDVTKDSKVAPVKPTSALERIRRRFVTPSPSSSPDESLRWTQQNTSDGTPNETIDDLSTFTWSMALLLLFSSCTPVLLSLFGITTEVPVGMYEQIEEVVGEVWSRIGLQVGLLFFITKGILWGVS